MGGFDLYLEYDSLNRYFGIFFKVFKKSVYREHLTRVTVISFNEISENQNGNSWDIVVFGYKPFEKSILLIRVVL